MTRSLPIGWLIVEVVWYAHGLRRHAVVERRTYEMGTSQPRPATPARVDPVWLTASGMGTEPRGDGRSSGMDVPNPPEGETAPSIPAPAPTVVWVCSGATCAEATVATVSMKPTAAASERWQLFGGRSLVRIMTAPIEAVAPRLRTRTKKDRVRLEDARSRSLAPHQSLGRAVDAPLVTHPPPRPRHSIRRLRSSSSGLLEA